MRSQQPGGPEGAGGLLLLLLLHDSAHFGVQEGTVTAGNTPATGVRKQPRRNGYNADSGARIPTGGAH